MTRLSIRSVKDDADIDRAADLRWRWVVEEDGGVPVVEAPEFRATFRAWVSEPAALRVGFLAELDGVPVGMCWVAAVSRVPSPRAPERRSADLQAVYVAPEVRRLGIGRRLVEVAIDRADELRAERLVVHSTEVAIPLYESAGFRPSPRLMQLVPAARAVPAEPGAVGRPARLSGVSQQKEPE